MKELIIIALLILGTFSCINFLERNNEVQNRIIELESNMNLNEKELRLHDRLVIQADNLYNKYLECLK